MRLIDADSFKQLVTAVSIADGHDAGFVNEFCKLIDSQPTAYDVEKVVAQIQDMHFDFQEVSSNKYKVLKIVKASGVSGQI